jgi:hypothetical protein
MKKRTKIIIVAISTFATLGTLFAFVPKHCHQRYNQCQTECCQPMSHHSHHNSHHHFKK